MTKKVCRRSSKAENERVRLRLAEAEETLRAIRSGEVDAIAVDGPHGRQLYTLQSADQPYRVLAERMSEGAASMTADGTIVFCNQRLSEMVGRAPGAMIGLPSGMLVLPALRKDFQECLARALKADVRREVQFQRVDGGVIPVLVSLSAIPGEQGPGLCLIAMDFSEHRRAEEKRKRAEEEVRKLNEELEQRVAARTEELRVLNKELEAFNYAVAHDLRAPLRHIHGFAEMLADEAKPVLTDSCKHQLDTILDSVQHMSELLEDLLKLSHLGRQELCKQACSANNLIAEVIKLLEPESKDREVEWRIARLAPVECDPALFKQVLVNLISNALKFTRTRHPAIIEIGQTSIAGAAAIFIRDNGVGFDMRYADKLFGLFQRLHRQQEFEGTGVGLAIVQRIMHRHGGKVWAEGATDKGATFYLSLHGSEAGKKELAAAHAAI